MTKKRYKSQTTNRRPRTKLGSALIIAVILTSLLAIIGVMFVMIARVDKMATSAISENKELNFAVETVVALVSQELVLDVPGVVAGAGYYDYPDANNAWLANLEPNQSGGNYYWRRISDIYNRLDANNLPAEIIADYPQTIAEGDSADADGDGVADSKWVELADMNSNKGRPIYAAIRVVDNGAMLNVNAAYKFDLNSTVKSEIDGSSQMQINLAGVLKTGDNIDNLHNARCGSSPSDWGSFSQNVIWQYGEPNGNYLPFDISDELELRYRYCLNSQAVTRFENVWLNTTGSSQTVPYDATTGRGLGDWWNEVMNEPNANKPDTRHLLTTYNMDRIIDPNGGKMVNINDANVSSLYSAIRAGLYDADPNFVDANGVAAQIAVNIIDYRDSDSDVCSISVDGSTYYGFEQPCIYISELAWRIAIPPDTNRSYAIELYKPDSNDADPCNWKLVISNGVTVPIAYLPPNRQYHVIEWQNTLFPLLVDSNSSSQTLFDSPTFSTTIFDAGSTISLTRDVNGSDVVVDSVFVPGSWLIADGNAHSIQRDIAKHKCIRRLWDPNTNGSGSPTLGSMNNYNSPDSNVIQAHPANAPFTNVGEIGMLFRKPAYYAYEANQLPPSSGVIGYGSDSDTEDGVRLNLADPNFQRLFKYLTVFDPAVYTWNDPNEARIKGRININTAPWYVIAQLPWVSQRVGGYSNPALAQAIVAYRDKLDLSSTNGPDYYHGGANDSRYQETGITGLREANGFESIGELAAVINKNNFPGEEAYSMRYYTLGAANGKDLTTFPDLTPSDGAVNDFEERDVIFARISNLVTVRSDVFTAYILVRIGRDGPQKRVMAILDRSNVYYDPVQNKEVGKVRIIALHPVPDPR